MIMPQYIISVRLEAPKGQEAALRRYAEAMGVQVAKVKLRQDVVQLYGQTIHNTNIDNDRPATEQKPA